MLAMTAELAASRGDATGLTCFVSHCANIKRLVMAHPNCIERRDMGAVYWLVKLVNLTLTYIANPT